MPDHIALFDRALKDRLTILQLYLCVQNTHRLNAHQRTHLTKAVTAALFHFHRSVAVSDLRSKMHLDIRISRHQLAHFLINCGRTAGKASGSRTY